VGAYIHGGPAVIVNNVFWNNTAADHGDALGIVGNTLAVGEIDVLHNTLVDNGGISGEAIQIADSGIADSDVRNNLIVGHAIGIRVSGEAIVPWDHNAFYGNLASHSVGLSPGPNDIHGDPMLFDRQAGDFHILPGSAAMDTGVDTGVASDFEGQARPQRGGVDIGADECREMAHTEVIEHLLGLHAMVGLDLELADDNADDAVDAADVVSLVNGD
jgi:hypothetical protein